MPDRPHPHEEALIQEIKRGLLSSAGSDDRYGPMTAERDARAVVATVRRHDADRWVEVMADVVSGDWQKALTLIRRDLVDPLTTERNQAVELLAALVEAREINASLLKDDELTEHQKDCYARAAAFLEGGGVLRD